MPWPRDHSTGAGGGARLEQEEACRPERGAAHLLAPGVDFQLVPVAGYLQELEVAYRPAPGAAYREVLAGVFRRALVEDYPLVLAAAFLQVLEAVGRLVVRRTT